MIPLWLGLVRYLTSEVEFEKETTANLIGLGIVIVLIGILYSMSIAIENLVLEQPALRNGLYVLFLTLAFTGVGAVFFIIRETPEVSVTVLIELPLLIVTFFAGALMVYYSLTGVAVLPLSTVLVIAAALSAVLSVLARIKDR